MDKSAKTKICPTCGTRIAEDTPRCLVCGTEFETGKTATKPNKAVQGSRMPEVTLSLPAALGLVILLIALGAVFVYFALRQTQPAIPEPTITPTLTQTTTPTITPTEPPPTATFTPLPSATPVSYKVAAGDTCSSIAFAFGVSIQSIVLLNELPATCDTIFPGQSLLIPQPTPTPTPQPTSTLSAAEATDAACEKVDYTVQANDTLSSIALNYNVSITVLKEYNGLVSDVVRSGQNIKIPLCERLRPAGPTPTPTSPPPFPAPNLLLPVDGAPFSLADETITLQWAAVGSLRPNEAYMVTVIDVTEGAGRQIVEYVTDTKFIVPVSFRPADTTPHVIRWIIQPMRQTGTDASGNPVWTPAGAPSAPRVFTWSGAGPAAAATPTP